MANLKIDIEITALLVIDPYNDFISEGGRIWDRLKAVADANQCVPHMLQVLNAARKVGLRVFSIHCIVGHTRQHRPSPLGEIGANKFEKANGNPRRLPTDER